MRMRSTNPLRNWRLYPGALVIAFVVVPLADDNCNTSFPTMNFELCVSSTSPVT